MKLILISNFSDIQNEHYLLNLLFCEGLEIYHLRKKNYSRDQMKAYIEKIPHYFHDRIVLHTHFDLIHEYNLKGAHFTKACTFEDYKIESPDQNFTNNFQHLSFSLHSIQEIKQIGSAYNYIFLSPIFDSISNTGYNSKFRINDLKIFLADMENRPEIIALSGITDSK
ncbi:MAG: thiamine phosphate synthase, partial [Cyclobacteriaceae bacterium]